MPAVSERFKTYHDFASATLADIYAEQLENALKLEANHLESGVWINEGKGGGRALRWQLLPWEAQLSPVNDIAAGDFDGDGALELILAQNHDSNWIETGRWRGNPGCHLGWDGSAFVTIPHAESGVVMPADTKAILVVPTKEGTGIHVLAGQNDGSLLRFDRLR